MKKKEAISSIKRQSDRAILLLSKLKKCNYVHNVVHFVTFVFVSTVINVQR